jgi:acyl-CoA synthetase (AMP-forming)/AMP-acid ligase II
VEIEGKGSGWLRTGDLGCLVKGEVLITGRLKDIVIVGGKNHAAEDLENCVQQALGLGGDVATVAFSVDGIDAEELIIAIEVGRDSESRSEILTARVNEALGTLLEITARAVIPVPRGRLPRTTSGKVRRQETKRLYVSHLPPFGKT